MEGSDFSQANVDDGRNRHWVVWLPFPMLMAFICTALWFSFSEHVHQAEDRAVTVARAVEQHASATIDRAGLALLSVVQRLKPADLDGDALSVERRKQLTEMLGAQHHQTRGVVSMSLTDARGVVLANSVGAPPGTDLGQRRYFLDLKSGTAERMAISEVVKGKVSNQWGLQIARRIDLPDGSFGGMIVANLGLRENFERFYETLGVGPQGLITLRSQDNTVLVRYPVDESVLGRSIGGSQGTLAVSEQVSEVIIRSISPADHIERITAIRRLPDFPIYALVGIPYRDMLSSWLNESAPLLAISLVILPLAGLVSVMVRRRFSILHELQGMSVRLEEANRELVEANALIEKQSLQDQLTGAWNRRFADIRLREAAAKATRVGLAFSLLMFDLDHFKSINDRWGHQVGDAALTEFVRLVLARLRLNDTLARWGGEEFLLLLEGSNSGAATALAEQLRTTVETHDFPVIGKMTVSIGVAEYLPGEPLHEFTHRVDMALYEAKGAGRNCVRLNGK